MDSWVCMARWKSSIQEADRGLSSMLHREVVFSKISIMTEKGIHTHLQF